MRSREHISDRIDEQIVDRLEAKLADLADTGKSLASQDRNLLGTVEQIPDVFALEMVEQLVELPKTVSDNGIQERTVEHITADIPVLQVAEELVEASKVFPEDRIRQRFAEHTIAAPGISLDGKVVEVLVTQTQEKKQQVANTHVQHVASTVKVEKPKIMKQTVQKAVTQEKINQDDQALASAESYAGFTAAVHRKRSSTSLSWRRDKSAWTRMFRRPWRFPRTN